MSDLSGAAESSDYADAEHHDSPVDFGNVDLAVHFGGGVTDGHPRETSECHCIADHGVCRRDHGLAGDDGRAGGYHEHRPIHGLFTITTFEIYQSQDLNSTVIDSKTIRIIHSASGQIFTWDGSVECVCDIILRLVLHQKRSLADVGAHQRREHQTCEGNLQSSIESISSSGIKHTIRN